MNAILVIDDDSDLRDLVRLVVEPMGLEVLQAASCEEGIAALRTHRDRVRLVLLDYFMPGMNPADCVRALGRLTDRQRIVLCTAAVDARGLAAALGLPNWLEKPFALTDLTVLVGTAAQRELRT
jgi:DNA-binding NtrC family response regulator